MYSIEFSETAEKQLYKLEKYVQMRILATLERIKVRPYAHVKKLKDSHYYRLRAGDYRVILDIAENRLIIFVIELGHRKNIYKI